ncbi:MAG: hypothetical protein KGL04_09275, partial [Elusimicrobia bacterium]|nr:hypothetical protein [Elusimicrobiota bacterium]
VPRYECDYMHASLQGADETFNSLPTLAAQMTMLHSVKFAADADYARYRKAKASLLARTDPNLVSPRLAPGTALLKIEDLRRMVESQGERIALPFLWPAPPAYLQKSYLDPAAGEFQSSWNPYIGVFLERDQALAAKSREFQARLIKRADAKAESKLRASLLALAVKKGASPKAAAAALAHLFDGGDAPAGASAAGLAPASLGGAAPAALKRWTAPLRGRLGLPSSLPPPIPENGDEDAERNYFARGSEAGLKRIEDDAKISIWHALGWSRTLGNPAAAAHDIITQKGPTCSIGAQYEAMRARGIDADIKALVREALDKGYYAEYGMASGFRAGGTFYSDQNALLRDHHIPSRLIMKATPAQVEKSVAEGGGAIVVVREREFWGWPSLPESAAHTVYVSGAEIDPQGRVLGYYVNDTGTGEAMRYVSASDFKKAWDGVLVSFAPPGPHDPQGGAR